jgi:hypothetical protein
MSPEKPGENRVSPAAGCRSASPPGDTVAVSSSGGDALAFGGRSTVKSDSSGGGRRGLYSGSMEIIPLALLGIVVVAGLVTLGVGHKGWSWGTLAASILVLFSAAGFVYLAARVAQRERVWRERVRSLRTDLAKTRDGMQLDERGRLKPIPNESSIADLEEQEARWYRALERVNTWRGRSWTKGFFQPPSTDKPGRLVFDLPEGAPPNPFINAGAQLFLFDSEAADDGGRFLGVFRVGEAKVEEGDLVLSVSPAARPGATQQRLWRRDFDSVQAFETLPVDRWLAFCRTARPDDVNEDGDEGLVDGEEPGRQPPYLVLPRLRRTNFADDANAEDLLADLEAQLDRFERHETIVPEEKWRPWADLAKPPPDEPWGTYWAAVTFTLAHGVTTREAGREPTTIQFEKGDRANLELREALGLEQRGVVEIRDVFYRRPLADLETALQGGETPVDQGKTIAIRGGFAIRGILENEIARIQQAIRDLQASHKNVLSTVERLRKEEKELGGDLPSWEKDATAAGDVRAGIESRLDAVSERLDAAWGAVVELGREFDGSMAAAQAAAEKRAAGPR